MSASSWTPAEDAALEVSVASHKGKNWKLIAQSIPGKTDTQCMHRWSLTLKPGIVKGLWTPQVVLAIWSRMRWGYFAVNCAGGR
jgi:hypothetical protein